MSCNCSILTYNPACPQHGHLRPKRPMDWVKDPTIVWPVTMVYFGQEPCVFQWSGRMTGQGDLIDGRFRRYPAYNCLRSTPETQSLLDEVANLDSRVTRLNTQIKYLRSRRTTLLEERSDLLTKARRKLWGNR